MKHNLMKVAVAVALLGMAGSAFATKNPPNECGNHGNNCNPTPTTPVPSTQTQGQGQDQTQGQAQGQGQLQGQIATGGNATGGNAAGGTGLGVGIGVGGAGGQGGEGGKGGNSDATAFGGHSSATGGTALSGSQSGATSGSASGVVGSGNSANELSNRTNIGDVGSTSGAISGSASNSGGNSLSNGSESSSGAASNSGGNSLSNGSTSGASSSSGGNTQGTNVDASSNDSYVSQSLFIPSVAAAAPAMVAGSNVIVDRGVCGPRQGLKSEDVNGVYIGMFRKSKVYLGQSDRLVDVDGARFLIDEGLDGRKRLIGHRPVSYTAVVGVAGSRSVGLGGGKTGGDWGNAGASGGSSMQRLVVQTNLESCVFAEEAPKPVLVETKSIGQ